MPYNIPVLRALVRLGYKITVIHKHINRKSSFTPPHIDHVNYIDEADHDSKSLMKLGFDYNPDLVFVCDWSMHKYNKCGAFLRKKLNVPVVVGCDTQWGGGKQWLNVLSAKVRHHRYFTHILIAGIRQFEYAKKLGFKNDQIIMNLLSADVDKFNKSEIEPSKFNESRKFLFVGRFINKKGIKQLLDAWESIENKQGSTLTMIGDGPLKDTVQFPEDVEVSPFLSQNELAKFASQSSCFILPSVFEPWAVVIQEFAAAGLPLIVTNSCGAASHFVINNYNGLTIAPGSCEELKRAIEHIINLPGQELFTYAKRSRKLSNNINPEMVAHSLISVL